jgi:hypothetical protein
MHVSEFAFYIRRRISRDHPYVIKGALTQAEDRGMRSQDILSCPTFEAMLDVYTFICKVPIPRSTGVASFSVRFSLAARVAIRSDLFMIVVSFKQLIILTICG